MDRLKCRALRIDGGGWAYGLLFRTTHKTLTEVGLKPCIQEFNDIYYTSYEVHEESISQRTGRLDRNNVEIYEGDYISCALPYIEQRRDGIIVYCEIENMFKIKWLSEVYKRVRGSNPSYTVNGEPLFHNSNIVFNVIGNKYE